MDDYHEFVPFCSASRVTRRLSPTALEAELTIGFRIFTEAYTSRIDYVRPSSIRIKSVQSSVFGHLISTWGFEPNPANPQECYVKFDVRARGPLKGVGLEGLSNQRAHVADVLCACAFRLILR